MKNTSQLNIRRSKLNIAKIFTIVLTLVLFLLFVLNFSNVFAMEQFDPSAGDSQFTPRINNIFSKILGFLQYFGAAIAVIVVIAAGIMMVSEPDSEEKAKAKIHLTVSLIALVLIFAGPKILEFIRDFIQSNLK